MSLLIHSCNLLNFMYCTVKQTSKFKIAIVRLLTNAQFTAVKQSKSTIEQTFVFPEIYF